MFERSKKTANNIIQPTIPIIITNPAVQYNFTPSEFFTVENRDYPEGIYGDHVLQEQYDNYLEGIPVPDVYMESILKAIEGTNKKDPIIVNGLDVTDPSTLSRALEELSNSQEGADLSAMVSNIFRQPETIAAMAHNHNRLLEEEANEIANDPRLNVAQKQEIIADTVKHMIPTQQPQQLPWQPTQQYPQPQHYIQAQQYPQPQHYTQAQQYPQQSSQTNVTTPWNQIGINQQFVSPSYTGYNPNPLYEQLQMRHQLPWQELMKQAYEPVGQPVYSHLGPNGAPVNHYVAGVTGQASPYNTGPTSGPPVDPIINPIGRGNGSLFRFIPVGETFCNPDHPANVYNDDTYKEYRTPNVHDYAMNNISNWVLGMANMYQAQNHDPLVLNPRDLNRMFNDFCSKQLAHEKELSKPVEVVMSNQIGDNSFNEFHQHFRAVTPENRNSFAKSKPKPYSRCIIFGEETKEWINPLLLDTSGHDEDEIAMIYIDETCGYSGYFDGSVPEFVRPGTEKAKLMMQLEKTHELYGKYLDLGIKPDIKYVWEIRLMQKEYREQVAKGRVSDYTHPDGTLLNNVEEEVVDPYSLPQNDEEREIYKKQIETIKTFNPIYQIPGGKRGLRDTDVQFRNIQSPSVFSTDQYLIHGNYVDQYGRRIVPEYERLKTLFFQELDRQTEIRMNQSRFFHMARGEEFNEEAERKRLSYNMSQLTPEEEYEKLIYDSYENIETPKITVYNEDGTVLRVIESRTIKKEESIHNIRINNSFILCNWREISPYDINPNLSAIHRDMALTYHFIDPKTTTIENYGERYMALQDYRKKINHKVSNPMFMGYRRDKFDFGFQNPLNQFGIRQEPSAAFLAPSPPRVRDDSYIGDQTSREQFTMDRYYSDLKSLGRRPPEIITSMRETNLELARQKEEGTMIQQDIVLAEHGEPIHILDAFDEIEARLATEILSKHPELQSPIEAIMRNLIHKTKTDKKKHGWETNPEDAKSFVGYDVERGDGKREFKFVNEEEENKQPKRAPIEIERTKNLKSAGLGRLAFSKREDTGYTEGIIAGGINRTLGAPKSKPVNKNNSSDDDPLSAIAELFK